MSQYTSYYLYQKYEKRGEQDWIPVYPNTYSISGDSENPMPLSAKTENDPNCGYVPVIEPIYEWRNMDITTDYYCLSCDAEEFKLKVSTPTSGYTIPCDSATTLNRSDVPTAATYALVGNCITSIGTSAFTGCAGLTGASLTSKVTSIGNYAFNGLRGLFDCSLPQSVTTIGNYAFSGCTSLMNVILPNSLTTLGDYAFKDCLSITDINIPNSLSTISDGAFYNCDALHTIYIPNSVTTIGSSTFRECSGLITITMPSGLTSIGDSAFTNCSGLTSITINATTPPTLGSNALVGTNDSPIYVPADSVNTYKAASGWSSYASRIQAII